MPKRAILLVLAALALALLLALALTEPAGSEARRDILARTNAARAQRGVPPLTQHPTLQRVADFRAERIASTGQVTHCVSPAEADILRCPVSGYAAPAMFRRFGPWAEVIVWERHDDPAGPVALWLADPPHAAVLLSPAYRWAGVGVATSADGWVATVEELD